jgi:hypothetical protein
MKALEVTGTIDEKGQLLLDRPLTLDTPGPVRIIVLFQEPTVDIHPGVNARGFLRLTT